MEFEYNPEKSKSNKIKHGIDFEEAKAIWVSNNVIIPAITRGEKRYMAIGKIGRDVYACIFTIRTRNIRIISCRKARAAEERIYHEKTQ